ncbi:hypothetical protein Pan14r_03880 [Crateriforma conspicua]|uniref:Uncharacterized protein n=1 Tax=Crateriforma conspicua TaxID=2527996 RepID=A0A5C5Y012_9PLAN|nr:hypothetical protein Pan14r_03880 [Crateriforma conspicua]
MDQAGRTENAGNRSPIAAQVTYLKGDRVRKIKNPPFSRRQAKNRAQIAGILVRGDTFPGLSRPFCLTFCLRVVEWK